MTAVIWYRTPYIINNIYPLILSFALGNDVELRSVLDILFNLAMGGVVDWVNGQLICSELDQVFMLQLDPSGKELLDGATYDTFFATVPGGIPSNVLPLFSSIQYTTFDERITTFSLNTYSSNLVVTNNYFKAVSRVSWCIIHHTSSLRNNI